MDHIEGVKHKLNAFAAFLDSHPEWQGHVVLIQVTTPPQRKIPKLESKISELVSRNNDIKNKALMVILDHSNLLLYIIFTTTLKRKIILLYLEV